MASERMENMKEMVQRDLQINHLYQQLPSAHVLQLMTLKLKAPELAVTVMVAKVRVQYQLKATWPSWYVE